MKKRLVILTVLAGLFFASCGSQPAKEEEPAKQSETPAAEQAAQPEKAEAKAPDFGEKGFSTQMFGIDLQVVFA